MLKNLDININHLNMEGYIIKFTMYNGTTSIHKIIKK